MEVSGQLHVPAALPRRKSPLYPLDRRLGGSQSRSGCGGEEKNFQPPPGIEPRTPIFQPRENDIKRNFLYYYVKLTGLLERRDLFATLLNGKVFASVDV
jgi:hypothetical protein